MSFSPETEARIEKAAKAYPSYAPNKATTLHISDTNLIEFISPAVVGKSTIMEEVSLLDDDFSYVTGFTSRQNEPRDVPGRYTYFNSEPEVNQLIDHIEAGTVVQYVVHPTTKKFYGSFAEDYHTEFAMLDTLFNAVDDLDRLAFKAIFKIAVVSRGEEWINRFLKRYPAVTDERTKRINEAKLCLEWMQNQPEESIIWLENRQNNETGTAQAVVKIVKNGEKTENLSYLANEMYEEALKVAT